MNISAKLFNKYLETKYQKKKKPSKSSSIIIKYALPKRWGIIHYKKTHHYNPSYKQTKKYKQTETAATTKKKHMNISLQAERSETKSSTSSC